MPFGRRKARPEPVLGGACRIDDRVDLLQYLAARPAYHSYLEIGCNRNRLFKVIPLREKFGVDPRRGGTHRMTSDEFFRQNDRKFDLVFVDGLHHADQVLRDVDNALAALNEGGVIVLHDCDPRSEQAQIVPQPQPGIQWNGDVWKAVVLLRRRSDLDVAVGGFDHGCGVLVPRPNGAMLHHEHTLETLRYADLERHREQWLRLMSGEELLEFLEGR